MCHHRQCRQDSVGEKQRDMPWTFRTVTFTVIVQDERREAREETQWGSKQGSYSEGTNRNN